MIRFFLLLFFFVLTLGDCPIYGSFSLELKNDIPPFAVRFKPTDKNEFNSHFSSPVGTEISIVLSKYYGFSCDPGNGKIRFHSQSSLDGTDCQYDPDSGWYVCSDVRFQFTGNNLDVFSVFLEIQLKNDNQELSFEDLNLSCNQPIEGLSIRCFEEMTSLKISNLVLRTLPEAVSLLSLYMLSIENCELSSLGNGFSKLSNLLELSLNSNSLTELPSLKFAGKLSYISLDSNKLTSISDLPSSLEQLFLSSNALTSIPSSLFQLTLLDTLDLRSNKLDSFLIETDFTGAFPTLSHLDLGDNDLRSIHPSFSSLSSLRSLYLNVNPFLEASTDLFKEMTGLTSLDVSHTLISGSKPSNGGLSDFSCSSSCISSSDCSKNDSCSCSSFSFASDFCRDDCFWCSFSNSCFSVFDESDCRSCASFDPLNCPSWCSDFCGDCSLIEEPSDCVSHCSWCASSNSCLSSNECSPETPDSSEPSESDSSLTLILICVLIPVFVLIVVVLIVILLRKRARSSTVHKLDSVLSTTNITLEDTTSFYL